MGFEAVNGHPGWGASSMRSSTLRGDNVQFGAALPCARPCPARQLRPPRVRHTRRRPARWPNPKVTSRWRPAPLSSSGAARPAERARKDVSQRGGSAIPRNACNATALPELCEHRRACSRRRKGGPRRQALYLCSAPSLCPRLSRQSFQLSGIDSRAPSWMTTLAALRQLNACACPRIHTPT